LRHLLQRPTCTHQDSYRSRLRRLSGDLSPDSATSSEVSVVPRIGCCVIARPSSAWAIVGALTFLALLALWELLVRGFNIPGWLLPAPSALALAEWRGELVRHSLVTLYETLLGFVLSIAISIPLAVAVVHSAILRNTIYPILLAFQSVPKVAIAPCSCLWIGFGTLPKIVVVFLVCFFPIIVATATGLSAVPARLMEVIRSLSASTTQTFIKVRFPTAMPYIFVGLKVAITLAVIGAVIGEFVGSADGLGYLILVSTRSRKRRWRSPVVDHNQHRAWDVWNAERYSVALGRSR
jgi:NitT/TauT family transport system permease protein